MSSFNIDEQKSLTASEVTVDRVLSHYLWNSPTPPKYEQMAASITDSTRTAIKIDAIDYMKNGAGKYASAADFKMFEKFFDTGKLSTREKPYSFEEIGNLLYGSGENGFEKIKNGFVNSGFNVDVSQYVTATSSADYVERAFIFGSTKVTVTKEDIEKLQFVVHADGSKEIRNLRITPKNDDFDFVGGDSASGLTAQAKKAVVDTFNAVFKATLDPKDIGKTVPIEYTDTDKLAYVTVTEKDFRKLQADKAQLQQDDISNIGMDMLTYPNIPLRDAMAKLAVKLMKSPSLYSTHWDSWLNWETAPSLSQAAKLLSPVIIDLDGDGVETVGLAGNIRFDHSKDGFAMQTGWAGKDDGLLVLDLNGNGIIDNGGELFGDNTLLADGSLAANGFEALKQYDTNKNGMLDSGDSKWSGFRIWQDAD